MPKGCLSKYEHLISKCIFATLLCFCLTGFAYKSYDCFVKFLSCPQGVEISTQHQTKVDFPSFTFCPQFFGDSKVNLSQKVSPYNWSLADECEIEFYSKFYSSKCPKTKDLWKTLTPSLEDFGFESDYGLVVKFSDRTTQKLSLNEGLLLKRENSFNMGSCYTLTLPKNLTEKAIFYLFMKLKKGYLLSLFIHFGGLFNLLDPWQSPEFKVDILYPEYGYKLAYEYQQNNALDFDGKECQKNKSYNFMKCIEDKIFQVSKIFVLFSSFD